MAEKSVDLEAVTRMVADEIALAHAMFDGTGRAPFVEFGFSDTEDIRAALERAERVEAAAREYVTQADAWAASNALVVHPTLGVPMFRRNVELYARDAAFAKLRAALAPAPGEEGK